MSRVDLIGYTLADVTNHPSIQQYLVGLDPKRQKIALARAINRTLLHARTNTVRGLAKILALRSKDIRATLRMRKAHANKLDGSLEGRGPKAIDLYQFSPSPKMPGGKRPKIGVSVRIRRDKGRVRIPGSFIARSRGDGQIGVFKRVRGDSPLPIRRLYGPAPMAYFLREHDIPGGMEPVYLTVEKDLEEFFDRQLEREFRFEAEIRPTQARKR